MKAFSAVSTLVPPKYPAVTPTDAPIRIAPNAATKPTVSEIRVPTIISASTERPKLSVPSG